MSIVRQEPAIKITGGVVKEKMGPFAIGTGIATLAITYPFAAVAVGLIETTEPVHWALRVFLALFCLPFIVIGAGILLGGIVMIVNTAAPGKGPFPLRMLRYLIRQATRPRHLIAAIPVGLLVAQYWSVSRYGTGFWGVGAELLERSILLEFIAIHATGFLGAATLIPNNGRMRFVRYGVLALFGAMYVVMTATQGWLVAFAFIYLIGLKLGPFLLSPPNLHEGGTLGLRWGFQTCVFLAVVAAFGGMESFTAGAVYWTAILVAELLGMMEAEILTREAVSAQA